MGHKNFCSFFLFIFVIKINLRQLSSHKKWLPRTFTSHREICYKSVIVIPIVHYDLGCPHCKPLTRLPFHTHLKWGMAMKSAMATEVIKEMFKVQCMFTTVPSFFRSQGRVTVQVVTISRYPWVRMVGMEQISQVI